MPIISIGEGGASLTEVVLAVCLIAFVAALGIEGFGGVVARSKGRAAAVELAGELRAARSHATMRRETVRVSFEEERATINTESTDTAGSLLRQLDFKERGVMIEHLSAGPSILFYPSGRVATPTTITLQNRRGERWLLTVSISGRVTIQ